MKEKRETKSERERERIEEVSFSLPFMSFRWSKLDMPRVKVALRDESYAWVLESQDLAKAQGSSLFFLEIEKRRCPGKSRYLR